MNYKLLTWVLVIVLIGLFSTGVSASIFDYNVYETDYFVVFYPDGCKYQAEEVLYYLDKYRQQAMDLVGNKDDFKTVVVIQDVGLQSYAGANPLTYKINLFTNNPSTYSQLEGAEGYNSWFRQIGVYKFTQLAQVSNASGIIGKINQLAGNRYSPHYYTPGWMKEGLAIVNESSLNQFEGRLNDGYYRSFIATRAKSSQLPSIVELAYNSNQSIYGAEFIDYLVDKYGRDKFTEFSSKHSDNYLASFGALFPSFGIDETAKQVYGKNFPELYKEWKQQVEKKYEDWQLGKKQIVGGEQENISCLAMAEDKLYYLKKEIFTPAPFTQTAELALVEYNLETEEKQVLKELDYSSNASLQVRNNRLYYAIKSYGVGVLYSYNLDTGWTRRELVETFTDFAVLDSGAIVYVKEDKDGFGSEVWEKNGESRTKLGQVDQLISEIRQYKDDFIIVSKKRLGSWNINQIKLGKDDSGEQELSLQPLINSPQVEKFIKVEGNKVYFTANYDQNYGVYQYNLNKQQLAKVTTGSYAVNGVTNDQKELYFIGLHNQGKGIYKTDLKAEDYPLPKQETEKQFNFDIKAERKNAVIKNFSYFFKPYIRFPYLEGQDVLGLTSYRIEYLNNLDSTVSRDITFDPYTNVSINNLQTSDNDRTTRMSLAYSDYPYTGDFVLGKYTFYLRGGRRKEIIFRNLKLNLTGTAFYSYNGQGENIIPTYSEVSEVVGLNGNVEFTHKLWGVKKGMWEPNIFIGNIYGKAFANYYKGSLFTNFDPYYPYETSEDDASDIIAYTYGYELLFEVLAGFNEQIVPTLGVEIYNNDQVTPYYQVKPYFNFKMRF